MSEFCESTIFENDGRYMCQACCYEWSACMSDDELPEFCSCGAKRIPTPCPHCGREEDGNWYKPCPDDSCPSNSSKTVEKKRNFRKEWKELEKRQTRLQQDRHDLALEWTKAECPVQVGDVREQMSKHDGDCTIYSCLLNGNPEDGICTCGYGRQQVRKLDYSKMYSEERVALLHEKGE